jgi:hypothetical protein
MQYETIVEFVIDYLNVIIKRRRKENVMNVRFIIIAIIVSCNAAVSSQSITIFLFRYIIAASSGW